MMIEKNKTTVGMSAAELEEWHRDGWGNRIADLYMSTAYTADDIGIDMQDVATDKETAFRFANGMYKSVKRYAAEHGVDEEDNPVHAMVMEYRITGDELFSLVDKRKRLLAQFCEGRNIRKNGAFTQMSSMELTKTLMTDSSVLTVDDCKDVYMMMVRMAGKPCAVWREYGNSSGKESFQNADETIKSVDVGGNSK